MCGHVGQPTNYSLMNEVDETKRNVSIHSEYGQLIKSVNNNTCCGAPTAGEWWNYSRQKHILCTSHAASAFWLDPLLWLVYIADKIAAVAVAGDNFVTPGANCCLTTFWRQCGRDIMRVTHAQETCSRNLNWIERNSIRSKFLVQVSWACVTFIQCGLSYWLFFSYSYYYS